LIAIAILYFLLRRIKTKSLNNEIKNFKRTGIIEIVLGVILIPISIFWFLSIQKDIDRTMPIFQPVAIMTSEPIKLLAIGSFLAGVIILITGGYYLFQSKKSLLKKSQ
jgi:hypothetical protein